MNATQKFVNAQYLLVIGIPVLIDNDGKRWVNNLWYKDLKYHIDYLKNFSLCCPAKNSRAIPDGYRCLSDGKVFSDIDFIELPFNSSLIKAFLNFPLTFYRFWRAVKKSDLVHSGVGGWPLPYAWLLVPIVKLNKKILLILVESSFWRVAGDSKNVPLKNRLRARLEEWLNSLCVRAATIAIFTQDAYRRELLKDKSDEGYVIPASWIDENTILADDMANELWSEKKDNNVLKLLFAARLEKDKGLLVLLEAISLLQKNTAIHNKIMIDIIGDGRLKNECESVSKVNNDFVAVRLLEPVNYGEEFFSILRNYDCLVVPNIYDEQPRIVFDAYSQGVPVLASNTPGLLSCANENKTGKFFEKGNSAELSDLIIWASQNKDVLHKMGLNGLEFARQHTHKEMHEKRREILKQYID